MFPRGRLGFEGQNLILDAASFGVKDVAAAKLCSDFLRCPAGEASLDLQGTATLHRRLHDLDSRMQRMA